MKTFVILYQEKNELRFRSQKIQARDKSEAIIKFRNIYSAVDCIVISIAEAKN